ncbi:MAG: BspA family leucine-rich repeat surface protein, partial [Prevotella sp.]|nr:BspA family leucine-rich repeat surface protein [Prevotella sp.]
LDWQTLTFYYDNQKSEWGQKEETHQYDNGYIKYRYVAYDLEGRNWKQDNGAKITNVVFDNSFANYNGLTDLSNFFENLNELGWVSGFENLNTQNVTTMEKMFYQCNIAQLDLRFLNTENVTNMKDMFNGCSYLNTIRCNDNWQRDGLVSTDMFLGCTELKGYDAAHTDATMANPEGYFTADEPYAVLDAEGTLTFYYNNGKEQMQELQTYYDWHLFSFTGTEWVTTEGKKWNDTNNDFIKKVVFDESFTLYHGLETTEGMFKLLRALESIEGMENLNTDNVTCMDEMFWCFMNLKQIDLSHFDTSNVTSMRAMFQTCWNLQELDVSSFNTTKVTDMSSMFNLCSSLTTIYCKTDWKLIAENNGITLQSADMFKDCFQLKGGKGTAYSEQCIDANYAHPDNVSSPGFFTCTVEKGNLNDDENIDEVDVEILTDAILGKIAITADLIAKGDMNYDGALTIADVTLLVDAILKQE